MPANAQKADIWVDDVFILGNFIKINSGIVSGPSLPATAFPVEISVVEVQLVWDPHDALAEVLLVDDEVAAVLPALHTHEVLGLVIIVEVSQQLRHGYSEITQWVLII